MVLRAHALRSHLRAKHHAQHICLHNGAHIRFVRFVRQHMWRVLPGVVDPNVDAAKLFNRNRPEILKVGLFLYVAGHVVIAIFIRLQLFPRGFAQRFPTAGEHNHAVPLQKLFRHRVANAARAARDYDVFHRNFSFRKSRMLLLL
ncbi:hypothetical protein SDC9_206527 [bioreactor metagenome]|uniref:Uncharacterized protein n=1 Tax=bioreactor metagenome TaxID=1076179 RepID=A0A645J6R1_9ZZZZ